MTRTKNAYSFIFSAFILILGLKISSAQPTREIENDNYLWLEEVEGAKALEWARGHNAKSLPQLENDKRYAKTFKAVQKILLADDRIPAPELRGQYIYNFWRDKKNVRGLWRRTSLNEYSKPKPKWEKVIDFDELALREKENWVFKGSDCLPPNAERCLISLSRGGKDAELIREFDTQTKTFVKNGFELPEAKSRVAWIDRDTLFVGTDFGPDSLTDSGYPRIVKVWKRGQPIQEAQKIFEGEKTDVSVDGFGSFRPEGNIYLVVRQISFYSGEFYPYQNGKMLPKLNLPLDASFKTIFQDHFIFTTRSEWVSDSQTFPQGALLSLDLKSNKIQSIFLPGREDSIQQVSATKDYLLLNRMHNVLARLDKFALQDGKWVASEVKIPSDGAASILSTDDFQSTFIADYISFLEPQKIYKVSGESITPLKQAPQRFNATPYESEQYWATSRDGTPIPYFIVHAKNWKLNSKNPTFQYGYGGFEISMDPYYLGVIGKLWLEKGGVFVLANIRGGGEFGPRWHEAAVLKNRQRAYDDFIAVSEDLIAKKITSPQYLGIQGGSNGGLLMGAMLTQRPDLYRAIICQVPLLDMLRYHRLLAGASWMAEYGDPDLADNYEFIRKYSPYQNVKPDTKYPKVFFTTSTKDDRVHPGHARKMVARLEEFGQEVLYYENIEGGHGGAANLDQTVKNKSREMIYFFQQLMPTAK